MKGAAERAFSDPRGPKVVLRSPPPRRDLELEMSSEQWDLILRLAIYEGGFHGADDFPLRRPEGDVKPGVLVELPGIHGYSVGKEDAEKLGKAILDVANRFEGFVKLEHFKLDGLQPLNEDDIDDWQRALTRIGQWCRMDGFLVDYVPVRRVQ
jgi:hypothetical protein